MELPARYLRWFELLGSLERYGRKRNRVEPDRTVRIFNRNGCRIPAAVGDVIRGTVEDVKVLPQAASAVAAFPSKKTLLPLLLAQFLNSYDSSSMNVAISEIAADLNTTATGVQTALAFYTLVMAASMIANSTLSDIMGIAERERSASLRYALISLGVAGLIGGVAALFLPGRVRRTAAERSSGQLELSAEIESLLPESAPQPPVKNI